MTPCMVQWWVEDGEEQCREVWSGPARIIFGMFTFAFQFLIPLSVSGEGGHSGVQYIIVCSAVQCSTVSGNVR